MLQKQLPSFRQLVQRAIGPEGLPRLQLLAYGDFSHGDRYTEATQLYCRAEQIFDAMSPSSLDSMIPEPPAFRELKKDD